VRWESYGLFRGSFRKNSREFPEKNICWIFLGHCPGEENFQNGKNISEIIVASLSNLTALRVGTSQ